MKFSPIQQCSLGAAIAALSFGAYAQTATEIQQAAQEALRQQQLQAQRQQEQLLKDRQSTAEPARITVEEIKPRAAEGGGCRDIQTIVVDGASLLWRSEIHGITAPYEGKCLGVKEIEAVLSELTRAYVQRGWISARAYLPEQDLTQGLLKILVLEGKLSDIRVEDSGQNSISVATAAPGLKGAPLNIRDLEQALDQINRLASNQASMDMLPGEAPGDTILVLHNQASRRFHISGNLDNHGSESTGKSQAGITLSFDNPLGLNDFISYTKRKTFPLTGDGRLSESDSISYIVPFGYSLVSLNANNSSYTSFFSTNSGLLLKSSGNSENYSVRFDHVLWRDAITRWNVYANFSTKESKSYLEDVLLEVASRKLSVWDVGAAFNTVFAGGALYLDLSLSQGVKSFDALRDDKAILASDPHAQFRKWTLNGNYFRPFKIKDHNFEFSSQWSSQYSNHVLYGSEQMMIGSLYTVRGFTKNSISGDHGFYVRNEIGMRQPLEIMGFNGSMRPWIGIDYGRVWNRNEGVAGGSLTGMAAGVKVNLQQGINFEIFGTKPLKKPSYLNFDPSAIWLRLGFSF